MNRRVLHRVILSFVCALSLVLIPMSYSWAASQSSPQVDRQDQTQTDRNGVDQQNQDVNQDDSINTDTNQRQKPASESHTMQQESQTKSPTQQKSTSSSPTTTDQQSREGLPASAGELPLLALIGVLSLVAAGSTRIFARAKSTR